MTPLDGGGGISSVSALGLVRAAGWARLGSVVPSAVPHVGQNALPAGASAPHDAQIGGLFSSEPQNGQKAKASSRSEVLQARHV